MKNYLTGISSFIVSSVIAVLFFGLALVVAMTLGNTSDKPYIFFSEDGDVLHFFGETLYISENSVKEVASLPVKATEHCFSLLPTTAKRFIKYYSDITIQSADRLISSIKEKFTGY